MAWSIEYYNTDVERNILELPKGLLSRYFRLADLMIEFGPNLGMPHSRSLGEGLFELRVKSKEGITRAFFCAEAHKRIVVLHVFIKKTQKTPGKELQLARRRMREILDDEA